VKTNTTIVGGAIDVLFLFPGRGKHVARQQQMNSNPGFLASCFGKTL